MWTLAVLALSVLLGPTLQDASDADQPTLYEIAAELEGRQAMGLYIFGHKIGWIISDDRIEEREGVSVLVMRSEMRMEMGRDDELDESWSLGETVYALTGEGDLIAHHETEDDNGTKTRTLVELDGDELVIVREFAGRLEQREVPSTSRCSTTARPSASSWGGWPSCVSRTSRWPDNSI